MNKIPVEIYRKMTPQEKFQSMGNMVWTARKMTILKLVLN